MKIKRLIHSIALLFLRSGRKRAAYLKKHHIHGKVRIVPHDMVNTFLKRVDPKQASVAVAGAGH